MAKLSPGLEPVHHPLVGTHVKLGKHAKKADRRNLQLAKYLLTAAGVTGLPRIPATLLRSPTIEKRLPPGGWGMMGNDRLGDCTCAAQGHSLQAWTALNTADPSAFTPTVQQVEAVYWATGTADDGRAMLDVLNYMASTGMAGHKVGAFAEIDRKATTTYRLTRAAIDLFGTAYLGLGLPLSAQTQTTWKVVPGAGGKFGSWGGHAVNAIDYDRYGLTVVTWGKTLKLTWGFYAKYCDEAYAVIAPDFLAGGKTPAGFNAAALVADLNRISE